MAKFRCVIFAAVSSKPQAEDDKDSIPNQIERARDIIKRRGWDEAREPIIVPGQSRSIDFLHEAMEQIPQINNLVDLARGGEIDLVVCRDYDRLARTRSLMTQMSSYFSKCRVQIYALDKPVEPISPEDLDRRGRAIDSAAMVEAIAGLQAEGEISRIVNRRYFGINAAMRRGRWPHPKIAYGYTRVVEHSADGAPIYTDVPRIVPDEAAIVHRIDDMYLQSGMGAVSIARALNAEKIPSPTGKGWRESTIFHILKNAFYCGYIVWGIKRMANVAENGAFVRRACYSEPVERLKRQLGKTPNAFDVLEHIDKDELDKHDIIIVEGAHERIRSVQVQKAIYRELDRKRAMGGRAASTSGHTPLFSGILECAVDGAPMLARRNDSDRIYYSCRTRKIGLECENKKWVREIDIYDAVMDILHQIINDQHIIDRYLAGERLEDEYAASVNNKSYDHLVTELGELEKATIDVDARRERWDDAYEANVIDLGTYSSRVQAVEDERASIDRRIVAIRRKLDSIRTVDERRSEILETISNIPEGTDRPATKVFLRRLIEKITIRDGQIERLIFVTRM